MTNHSSSDKQPSWGSNGTLAFSSDRNSSGGFNIYLVTLDPWNVERLTNTTSDDVSPAISPDGSKIAFVSQRDGDSEIYVLTIADNTLTKLTDNSASDADPEWSTDGDKIAFASNRDGDWDIYVADDDGSNVTNLTDSTDDDKDSHNDRWPDFGYYDYGDGTGDEYIAFASDRDGDWEVWTMFSDGTDEAKSTANSDDTIDSQPSWGPLGENLVIHSNRDTNYEVATMYYDGSSYSNISKSSTSRDAAPDWEPVEDGVYCGE